MRGYEGGFCVVVGQRAGFGWAGGLGRLPIGGGGFHGGLDGVRGATVAPQNFERERNLNLRSMSFGCSVCLGERARME